MTTIVQAHAAEDLLALVPQLLGFTPESSLVIVLFAGRRSRGALRLTLPSGAPTSERAATSVAERALDIVGRAPGVDGVVPVLFVDEPFGRRTTADGRAAPPGRAVADAFIRLADARGLVVKDALCSARDGWGSYLDPGVPVGGRPTALVSGSPVTDLAPVRDELVTTEIPSASPERCAAVQAAIDDLHRRLDEARVAVEAAEAEAGTETEIDPATVELSPAVAVTIDRLSELPILFESALVRGVDGASVQDVAELLVALRRSWASDVALMQWAFGKALGDELFDAEREHRMNPIGLGATDLGDVEVFHRVARLVTGDGARPDVERIQSAIALLLQVTGLAPERYRPSPLCMLAWFSWALGQSTRAAGFLAQLAEIDPGNSLAPTVQAMVDRGHLPGWAFAREGDHDAADSSAAGGDAAAQPAA